MPGHLSIVNHYILMGYLATKATAPHTITQCARHMKSHDVTLQVLPPQGVISRHPLLPGYNLTNNFLT